MSYKICVISCIKFLLLASLSVGEGTRQVTFLLVGIPNRQRKNMWLNN